jgi:hypothetical protein
MKFIKFFICAIALTLAMFSANKASAFVLIGEDVLTLNITFHTQEIDTNHSAYPGLKYQIVQTTLDTIDVLNALAKDLGVTSNGVAGFPEGSYLVVLGNSNTVVKSNSGQTWDVSPYLQYSLASDVILLSGTVPAISPAGQAFAGISYTSLVHVHFEDADHVADFTGIAKSQPVGAAPDSVTCLSSASGSGMLNGTPALITAHANLKFQPLLGPVKLTGYRGALN